MKKLTNEQIENLKNYIKGLEIEINRLEKRLENENNKQNPDYEYKLSIKIRIKENKEELEECYGYLR